MDTIGLLDAARQQQGLTSDNQLALRLGIRRGRVSDIRAGRKPLDEAEIFMLAEMAKIDPKLAAAIAKKGREKNPAKQAYWERIAAAFSMALFVITLATSAFPTDAQANAGVVQSTNYT